jgi:hypothetical protein
MDTLDFLVRKDQLGTTTLRRGTPPLLAEGQVRVAIERFALTTNNITYGAMGEALQYWQFFPVADDAAWGRIPVWGFGVVQDSRHPALVVGERLYGYFPMASSVDLTPGKVSATHFFDEAPHRAGLHGVYNQYMRCAADPFYTADTEDLQALLRPLFITSWLVDDFLADNRYFGAADEPGRRALMLLSSASSKTAYGTAFQLARRGEVDVVGLTSDANVAFCESLGCYQQVLSYGQLAQLPADAPCVYVDLAGNAALRREIHTRFAQLRYSCSIGAAHLSELGGAKDLPGPRATLFFAPAQIKKRSAEWGGPVLTQRMLQGWQDFIATVSDPARPWIQVQQHRGPAAVQAVYQQLLGGRSDPRLGHMLSLAADAA